jgi:hypothetical protein
MTATIPERVLVAVAQGEQLVMHSLALRYFADLRKEPWDTPIVASGASPQAALDELNAQLPLTMREIAVWSTPKAERRTE